MTQLFRTAGEIRFGAGEARRAPEEAARLGRRILLVTGARSLDRSGFLESMKGVDHSRWRVPREPDVALIDEGAKACRDAACDVVLAVGGGSVIDAAKAVSALAVNEGSVLDYLEGVGSGRKIERPPLPMIAVPTTAGTGCEVTLNAVIQVPEKGVKRSFRNPLLMPRVAIVDPELSAGMPREVAASTGLDALTHLVEAYTSNGAQPMTDALARPGIELAMRGLRALAEGKPASDLALAERWPAFAHHGAGASARQSAAWCLSLAALWGGMVLANAGLGAVHGLVAPLCGRCPVPHGLGCASLLPETLEANLKALEARDPGSRALARYREIGVMEEVAELRRKLGVRPLGELGVTREDIDPVVRDSRGSSMKYNPVVLTDDELRAILLAAL